MDTHVVSSLDAIRQILRSRPIQIAVRLEERSAGRSLFDGGGPQASVRVVATQEGYTLISCRGGGDPPMHGWMGPGQRWFEATLQARHHRLEGAKQMSHASYPALGAQGRPAEDVDPLREYEGPLSETMTALREAVAAMRRAGGINSGTLAQDALRGATVLGDAFLHIGPEYARKLEPPTPEPSTAEQPRRRGLFKKSIPVPQADTPLVRIWWAYGGANRDGTIKWPGWSLAHGRIRGPGEPYRIYAAVNSPELSGLQVGLTLLADDPSGDVAYECASCPEAAWEHIRYGGSWEEGDMLDRAARATRFVVDSIAPVQSPVRKREAGSEMGVKIGGWVIWQTRPHDTFNEGTLVRIDPGSVAVVENAGRTVRVELERLRPA